MKIAIATDDRENVAKRTGRAAYICVTEIKTDGSREQSFRVHEHGHGHGEHGHGDHGHGEHGHGEHGHAEHEHREQGHGIHRIDAAHDHHDHKNTADILRDCDVFLVHHVGPHLKEALSGLSLQIVNTRETELEAAIDHFLKQSEEAQA